MFGSLQRSIEMGELGIDWMTGLNVRMDAKNHPVKMDSVHLVQTGPLCGVCEQDHESSGSKKRENS
jgi:hypothetical protein